MLRIFKYVASVLPIVLAVVLSVLPFFYPWETAVVLILCFIQALLVGKENENALLFLLITFAMFPPNMRMVIQYLGPYLFVKKTIFLITRSIFIVILLTAIEQLLLGFLMRLLKKQRPIV